MNRGMLGGPVPWALGAVLMLGACDSPMTSPERPRPEAPLTPLRPAEQLALTLRQEALDGDQRRAFESDILALDAQVSGIGGVYYDPEVDEVVVSVTNASSVDLARTATENLLNRKNVSASYERGRPGGQVRVITAEFRFSTLVAWAELLLPDLLNVEGWTELDADERRNRIAIGVTDESAEGAILDILASHEIPAEAVHFEVTQPMQALASLRDRVRPAGGGLQIQGEELIGGFGGALCTAGWPVSYGSKWGYLTAGHCSGQGSGVTGEDFYQNTESVGNGLGSVWENPDWDATGCEDDDGNPWNGTCTDADAMWITLSNWDDLSQLVWLPEAVAINNDKVPSSLEISASKVVGAPSTPMAGYQADKIGRTTGWTGGTVVNTCRYVEIDRDGDLITDFVLKCAGVVEGAAVGDGDSGAPVFGYHGTGPSSTAAPYGVLAAGGPNEHTDGDGNDYCEEPVSAPTCRLVYSTIDGIEDHFGHAFDYSSGRPIKSVQISGPFEVQPYAYCTWQAFVTGGTSPFSYSWSGVLSGTTSLPYISGSVSGSGYLHVTVTDDNGQQDQTSFWITVDGNADECIE